jgi:hypothetical protein
MAFRRETTPIEQKLPHDCLPISSIRCTGGLCTQRTCYVNDCVTHSA